ncbi:MAG TPA: glycosyltransferase family 39 protein [Anaerolineaceae bacterium]|nr:glycosyltransferase family 39 protein [Anaerolineaceae bacterium]
MIPINNSDSLHTHLPRIFYWIQHGSMAYWDAITVTQLNYPIILSVQGVWLFLLGGSELLFYLATWSAQVVTVVLLYKLAILLGFSKRGSLLAALIGLSFPVVLLQTFSYQADLFVAALGLSSAFFLMLFIKEKKVFWLYSSFLPLALSLGSKQTAFIFLPFFLLVQLILYCKKHMGTQVVLRSGAVLLLFFILFSSYKFIQNAMDRDKMTSSMFAAYRYAVPFSQAGDGTHYATNAMRYLYNGTSLDGLTGSVKIAALSAKEELFRSLSGTLKLDLEVEDYVAEGDKEYFKYSTPPPLNEDAAWFGPLSLLLFPVTAVIILIGEEKKRKLYLGLTLAYLLSTFLLISILVTSWNPSHGRYLILPMLLFAPLFAVLVPRKSFWSRLVIIVLSITALYLSVSTLLINDSRPIVTRYSLYSYQQNRVNHSSDAGFFTHAYAYLNDRVIEDLALTSPDRRDIFHQSYYENLFHQSTDSIIDIIFINANVEVAETLYLYMQKDLLEYALFGVNKTRDLVPVNTAQQVPSGALLLVDKAKAPSIADGLRLLAENERFVIYQKP